MKSKGPHRRDHAIIGAVLILFAGAWTSCGGKGNTPPPVRVESTAFDFIEGFSRSEVRGDAKPGVLLVEPVLDGSARRPAIRPRLETAQFPRTGGGIARKSRPALVVPRGASVAYNLTIPPGDAAITFTPALNSPGTTPSGPLRLTVLVNGEEVHTSVLDPGAQTVVTGKPVEVQLRRWVGLEARVEFRCNAPDEHVEMPLTLGFVRPRLVLRRHIARLPKGRDKRNVLLVVVDTLRADRLSCYGYERPNSPNLDALAARARLYRWAFSSSSWTWPATASLLTALHPPSHGVLGHGGDVLDDSLETLPETFAHAGYSTFGISANPLVSEDHGFAQGFETFLEHFNARASQVVDRYLEWRAATAGSAFFAYLHFMDPHYPYRPPDTALRVDNSLSVPRDAVEAAVHAMRGPAEAAVLLAHRDAVSALYDAEIRYLDVQFGRLLQAMRDSEDLDDTIIVVTSDHGEEFWDHGSCGHRSTLFQEVLHVPLIVDAPADEPGVFDDPVGIIDVLPTITTLAGVSAPPQIDGVVLPGTKWSRGGRAQFATTSFASEPKAVVKLTAVIDGGLKLILTEDKNRGRVPLLFDLTADPDELRDRSAERPAERRRLETLLGEWADAAIPRIATRDRPWLESVSLERLAELGYLGEVHKAK